jgi:hypothetical protein
MSLLPAKVIEQVIFYSKSRSITPEQKKWYNEKSNSACLLLSFHHCLLKGNLSY